MRVLVSYLLTLFISVQSVLPGFSVLELSKLPALVQHYNSHRSANAELSFLAFIELHYSDELHHEQDHKEHHKLPFNDHQSKIHATCFFYFVSERSHTFNVLYFPIGQTNQTVYHSIVEEDVDTHVWQPPRNA